MLTSEWGVDFNKCSEALGFSHFSVQSPCNPLIKDYTQIFYMIDEGDILSIHCQMNIRGSKYMRNVDDLNLVIIDFYVPALTPHLSNIEASLQVSESITLLAVCRIYTGVISKET
jgi:hypothetical protein